MTMTMAACGSRSDDGDGESGDSSAGDGSGDASGEGGGVSDEELRADCASGCVRFKECAPESYDAAYADDQACADYCFQLFDAPDECRSASVGYRNCTRSLACVDWPALLNDPATSACAESWAPVAASCPVP